MAFPHRLKFVLLLICCMQHALASISSTHVTTNSPSAYVKNTSTPVTTSSSSAMAVNNTVSTNGTFTTGTPTTASTKASATATVEPTSTTHDTTNSSSTDVKTTSPSVTKSSSMSTRSKASAKAVVNNTASKDGTSTTGTPMTATKKASPTATVQPTSTTHDTTNSSSSDVKTTSPSATTSSSMSTIRNVTFSIGTGYSSPDCASCSIGGTITVTMSCSIKMPPNDDKKCDKDEFNKTSCDYVTMVGKVYSCADVKKNFTYYEKKYLKPVKQCDDVCPATGTASFSIGTEYSSPDCTSCSIGGTITVTMSCSIKVLSNDDKKCDKDEFNKTRCGYVVLANEKYRCADVKKNFAHYEKKHLKPVKQCGDVCPTSGSVLSAHLVFIFSSGLAVGLLSQIL